MRLIGLDYGAKTVGVAVSDPLGIIAQPLETIRRERENKLRRTLARIRELVREYEAELLVLGMPIGLGSGIGERAKKTLEFRDTLEAGTGLPVVLWDERLTTVQAERVLTEAGIEHRDQKQYVDRMAAALILQGYMDYKGNEDHGKTPVQM